MRKSIIVALIAFSSPAFAVDGVNLPGHDYANFDAPSAFVCRTTCGGESNCQAYTWVKPGIQGPSGHCWLKSSEPAIVKDGCCELRSTQVHSGSRSKGGGPGQPPRLRLQELPDERLGPMPSRVRRGERLLLMDLCQARGPRSVRTMLAQEGRRPPCSGRQLHLRGEVHAGIGSN